LGCPYRRQADPPAAGNPADPAAGLHPQDHCIAYTTGAVQKPKHGL